MSEGWQIETRRCGESTGRRAQIQGYRNPDCIRIADGDSRMSRSEAFHGRDQVRGQRGICHACLRYDPVLIARLEDCGSENGIRAGHADPADLHFARNPVGVEMSDAFRGPHQVDGCPQFTCDGQCERGAVIAEKLEPGNSCVLAAGIHQEHGGSIAHAVRHLGEIEGRSRAIRMPWSAKIRNSLDTPWRRPVRVKSALSFQPCMGFDTGPFLSESPSFKELRNMWREVSVSECSR